MLTVRIPPVEKKSGVLALGCWEFGGDWWGGQDDTESLAAMDAALKHGVNHFDTAAGYGDGHSERIVGQFLQGKRDQVFVASKLWPTKFDPDDVVEQVNDSLRNLRAEVIDLYYIHWPLKDDMRPVMEGLEKARRLGKVQAIGVSNFSVEHMELVSEAGTINAHQLCYNLLWRYPERDLIPYCREHDIAVVTYSSLAQGILAGAFSRHPRFKDGDQRNTTVFFDPDVWPYVYEAVEQLKTLAQELERPLAHLAIRWVAQQPDVTSVLVGARNAAEVKENAAAMSGDIPHEVFDRMTEISDQVTPFIPDVGNIFRYYP